MSISRIVRQNPFLEEHQLVTNPTHRKRPQALLRFTAMAALLWGFGAHSVSAQAPYRQEVIPGFSSISVDWYGNPDPVDLDADGDLDIVVGFSAGIPQYFENIGTCTSPVFVEVSGARNPFSDVNINELRSPDLEDLDGDGDLDIIGLGSNGLVYYENIGTSSKPAFVEITGEANPFYNLQVSDYIDPKLVDLDGDGDLDAVVGRYFINSPPYQAFLCFQNVGTSTSPTFVNNWVDSNPLSGIYVNYSSSLDLADLNDDGDLDAIVGDDDGTLAYFENVGSVDSPTFIEIVGPTMPFLGIDVGNQSKPELVDLDCDGDLDAIVGHMSGIHYFENTGTRSNPDFIILTGSANPISGRDVGGSSDPELVDLDADGDLDAIVGSLHEGLLYFENIGTNSDPEFIELTGTNNPFSSIHADAYSHFSPELVDLDDDRDLDLIVGHNQYYLRYFENTGTSRSPHFVEVDFPENPTSGIFLDYYVGRIHSEFVDLDGDGDLDAVTGDRYGSLEYFENTGTRTFPVFVHASDAENPFFGTRPGGDSNPKLIDFDGDGDLDAIVGFSDGTLVYLENTGTSSRPAFVEAPDIGNPFSEVDVGSQMSLSPEVVDIDDDGDLDLIVGNYHGYLVFYRSQALSPADRVDHEDASNF